MSPVREWITLLYKRLIHKAMKPQDLLVLLKKMTTDGKELSCRGLAASLGMNPSSVSESLERSKKAQLVDRNKKRVNTLSLQEFLIHGVQYVFPAEVGRVGRGMPTYVSASPIKEQLTSTLDSYVWHDVKGTVRGQQIELLYPTALQAALKDEELYQWLVIVDTLRMGRARERAIAIAELNKRIQNYAKNQ